MRLSIMTWKWRGPLSGQNENENCELGLEHFGGGGKNPIEM